MDWKSVAARTISVVKWDGIGGCGEARVETPGPVSGVRDIPVERAASASYPSAKSSNTTATLELVISITSGYFGLVVFAHR